MELVERVHAITGHRFADEGLLLAAFTHASWAHEHPGDADYERLEFLGDAVLGLCTTRLLYARFPDAREGELNDLRQKLVRADTLSDLGRDMGLAPHIRVGGSLQGRKGEAQKLLGDVVEAVLGALFQEAGLEPCQAVIDRWIGPRVAHLATLVADKATGAAKSRLQEFTQARYGLAPAYEVRQAGKDHELTFTAVVKVAGEPIAEGTGRKKKDAEADAAHLALVILERRAAEAAT